VAILHDNGPDGKIVGTTIWPQMARQSGANQIVANVEFPVRQCPTFTAAVQKARTSGADILLVDCVTPQAISLRKQMAAVGWTPKVMVNREGRRTGAVRPGSLGSLADGVIVGAYWDPSFPYPGAKELQQAFESENRPGHRASTSRTATPRHRYCWDAISHGGLHRPTEDQRTRSRRPTRTTRSAG